MVPVRCFTNPLSRLSDVLSQPQRAELTRRMASRVLTAASPYPVYVATHNEEVNAWATDIDVPVILLDQPGLSTAAGHSLKRLAAEGIERVVIAHADLAIARTLEKAIGPGVVIATDRECNGSNVVCVPSDAGFRFSYGQGSLRRHINEAKRLGLPVKVVTDPNLATDIDDYKDLATLSCEDLNSLGVAELPNPGPFRDRNQKIV